MFTLAQNLHCLVITITISPLPPKCVCAMLLEWLWLCTSPPNLHLSVLMLLSFSLKYFSSSHVCWCLLCLLLVSLSYCCLCLCQISLFIPSVLMPHKRWKVDVSRVDGSAQPGFATDLSLICIIITFTIIITTLTIIIVIIFVVIINVFLILLHHQHHHKDHFVDAIIKDQQYFFLPHQIILVQVLHIQIILVVLLMFIIWVILIITALHYFRAGLNPSCWFSVPVLPVISENLRDISTPFGFVETKKRERCCTLETRYFLSGSLVPRKIVQLNIFSNPRTCCRISPASSSVYECKGLSTLRLTSKRNGVN